MLCTVTGSIADAGLDPVASTLVEFTPYPREISRHDTDVINPTTESATTDAAGDLSIALVPGAYMMRITAKATSFAAKVTVPDASAATLAEILLNPTPDNLTAAEQAVVDAQTARDKARLWADEDEDTEVETGAYSAKHHAAKAAGSAAASAWSASASASSASAASSSQTAASEAQAAAELARDEAVAAEAASTFAAVTLSGDVTITRSAQSDGWFDSAAPFASVALSPARADTSYSVEAMVTSADDFGAVGQVIAYDLATNGFKLKVTGSTDNIGVRWRIVEAI